MIVLGKCSIVNAVCTHSLHDVEFVSSMTSHRTCSLVAGSQNERNDRVQDGGVGPADDDGAQKQEEVAETPPQPARGDQDSKKCVT